MEGIERLEKETLEMNDHNVILIFDYIKNKEELQNKFNNEEKSIKGMYDFICCKARSLAVQNVAMVNDKIVYLWAMTYFNKSNEELGITKKNTILVKDEKKVEAKKEKVQEENNSQVSLFEEVKK